MRLVPTTRTPLTAAQTLAAFYDALVPAIGGIGARVLAMVTAQSALETGRWKSLYCFNFGNEKVGSSWDGDYYQIRCNEIIDHKVVWFDPPHPQTWFRAFDSAAEGADSHIEFLTKHEPTAFNAALAGDPVAYAHQLKVHGYYTASEALYARAVVSLFNEFLPIAQKVVADAAALREAREAAPKPARSPVSDADLVALAPLVDLPDWRPDLQLQTQADALAADLDDAAGDAARAQEPTGKIDT